MTTPPPKDKTTISVQADRGMPCPVCGDDGHLRALCKTDGFNILACATCGAEHAQPVPSAAELKAYYDRPEWFEGGERGGYQNYDAQTEWSAEFVGAILDQFESPKGLSILDVGCGYGTHLALASKRGWKCFGVEVSNHARGIAQERLAGAAYIVDDVANLIPHAFDLVLILDTIEHLPSPYTLLYGLFSIGAITEKTRVVISTPNAGSAVALRDPARWAYRHPPSHLVYYKAEALTYLLRRLHFTKVEIQGLSPDPDAKDAAGLQGYGGLLAVAEGSDFTEFMRERYVPGTWSKIAEYEHVPRYDMAKDIAKGKTILDFGCGSGYGSALLAKHGADVTGLDIDAKAIAWARDTHHVARLRYLCQDDLGASLPERSFDMVTCFEMIEHVDHATQKAVVGSFARLLRDDGVLMISTPNPEVTKLYGVNPYHIREMNEAELRELLTPHFPSILIMRQYVRTGVMFDQAANQATLKPLSSSASGAEPSDEPLAFIAVCSRGKTMPVVPPQILFDREIDYIADFMHQQNVLNKARLEAYEKSELAYNYKGQVQAVYEQRDHVAKERDLARNDHATALHEKNLVVIEREAALHQRNLAVIAQDAALHEKNLAVLARETAEHEREVARHERNIALIERDTAVDARDNALREVAEAMNEVHNTRYAYHYLSQRRDAELASPRFLARRLYEATRDRLQAKFNTFVARMRAVPQAVDQPEHLALPDPLAREKEAQQSLAALMERPPFMAASAPDLVCSMVIPTKNGGDLFKRVVAGLQRQTIWPRVEFIIVDSGSTDDTIAVAQAAGAKCVSIPPAEFNHGATRDYAIGLASCDRVVLSVQDAIPLNETTLEHLIATLDDPKAAGGYARQIPQPDADQITKRNLNTWLTGRMERDVRSLPDPAAYEAMTPLEKYFFCNFDNVCSVIRKSVWQDDKFGRIGFGEDIDWAERVLKKGHRIVYEPAAAVVHSHDRPLAYEYKRTYVCHRKLYAQFGLHMVPSRSRVLLAWFHLTLADMSYVIRSREALGPKLKLLLKLPALNALQAIGQYLGARDERRGRQSNVSGV